MKHNNLISLLFTAFLLTSCETSIPQEWPEPVTTNPSATESQNSQAKDSEASTQDSNISSTLENSQEANSSENNSSEEQNVNYYKDEDPITDKFNYKTINNSYTLDALPSKGTLDVLVIPIQFTDYKFVASGRYSSETELATDLDHAFNGNGETDTGYWESLSSFYDKSSFGNLKMNFEIAPIFSSSYSTKTLKRASGTTDGSTLVMREAIANYKSVNGEDSTQKFDSDNDGFIDSVMLIYSCHNSYDDETLSRNTNDQGDLFWAYCYWDYNNFNQANVASPIGMSYFWCSYDFFYRSGHTAIGESVDTHAIIHETGHLLGLDDYYTYDSNSNRSYTGYADMMEGNICDHDTFSKVSLGWIKPYVVTGDCTITIHPSETSGDCIILADDYNGTAFDEYLMLELFTPEGLNDLDSHTAYTSDYPVCFSQAGVKLFHVDSRITTLTNDEGTTGSYFEPNDTNSLSASKQYRIGATNSTSLDSGAAYNKGFDLIKLITQNKKTSQEYGTNANLFKTGNTFSLSSYSSQFPKKTKLNNGKSLDYTITFDSVSDTSATITFTKTA